MNWGKGIIGGMIIFMLFIIGMCIRMFMAPADEYDHQYYEKGLSFNHDYEREQQVIKDNAKPLVKIDGHHLYLTFSSPVKGNLRFMRPSDTKLDRLYQIDSGDATVVDMPLVNVTSGQWQLIFEWTGNKKQYLCQQEVYIK